MSEALRRVRLTECADSERKARMTISTEPMDGDITRVLLDGRLDILYLRKTQAEIESEAKG